MQTLRTGVFAVALLAGLSCALSACQKDDKNKAKPITQLGSGSGAVGKTGSATELPAIDLDSKDILSRAETFPEVYVKHVLISWKGAGASDPRSENRSNDDAAKLAKEVMAKLKATPANVDAIVSEFSEDPGSAKSGEPYQVKSDTPFVPEFKKLALRLKDGEVGIVKTSFGYHVMIRTTKPPPDPLESADILARPAPAETASVFIRHLMITFQKGGKAEADRRAKDVLARAGKGEDFAKLTAEASELPDAKDQKPTEINTKTPGLPDNFKNLAMRLKMDEVGVAKSQGGWHVMKRVGEPPPDPLQSNDILKRAPDKGTVHVRHIMIGWKGASAGDPRAEKREKADADKLAKEVLGKAKTGDFVKLMKEHSEEKGSADTGKMYEVTADGRLPDSFKKLAMRLKVNETGLVLGDAGWHVMKRFAPPPPDNLESAAILKRATTTQKAKVKHVLLGWAEVHGSDPRGEKRTRAELEKLVKETVAKLAKGDKIEPIMKEISEDPGSAQDGKSYDVEPQSSLVPPFKNLSLRLNLNEVGVVKTDFGIHIIQRVE
ncbi:MAG TPA: peptidylprolyl isomerase [Kofleriaceae bacterium]